jgi:hypothetical protein
MSTATKTEIDATAFERPLAPTDVISVRLEASGGARWTAVGGGETVGDAVEFALASAPARLRWRVAGWTDAFGE